MWLETLLNFKEYFLYTSISIVLFRILFRRGSFSSVGRIKHFLLVGIGILFPFIDVIETWFGLEYGYEGNPLVLWYIRSLPTGHGWAHFILGHLAFSALAFYLGWKGKSEEAVSHRAFLGLLDILWVVGTTGNALLMKLYGVI